MGTWSHESPDDQGAAQVAAPVGVEYLTELERRVREALDELARTRGVNWDHVHIDSGFASGLPSDDDTAWIDLARWIASEAARHSQRFLIEQPLLRAFDPDSLGNIRRLSVLDPWSPLAIYALAAGHSPYDERSDRWVSDDVEPLDGCKAWVEAVYESENELVDLPPYEVALYFETLGGAAHRGQR